MIETWPCNFRGHHDVPTVRAHLLPTAKDTLRQGIGLSTGRDGVHFGRVDEVDPPFEGHVQLPVGLSLTVLLAPGHGAKAQGTDPKI